MTNRFSAFLTISKRRRVLPTQRSSKAKKVDSDPVLEAWICEDHNEALVPIQRLIGSKCLPFDNLAMVHFDGHPGIEACFIDIFMNYALSGYPVILYVEIYVIAFSSHPSPPLSILDLLVPRDLLAKDVFDKDKFNSDHADIAEWILPLVYAGHLRTVLCVIISVIGTFK